MAFLGSKLFLCSKTKLFFSLIELFTYPNIACLLPNLDFIMNKLNSVIKIRITVTNNKLELFFELHSVE